MAGMGLNLTFPDIKRVFLNPKGLLLGLISQMIFLPVLAFLISFIPGLTPEWKVGLMLVAICPGGATSNLLNYLLRGNLALSVSLATVNSFITLLTIPVFLHLSLQYFIGKDMAIELPFSTMLWEIFYLTLLPVIVGMIVRGFLQDNFKKITRLLNFLMPMVLGLAMIGAIFLEKKEEIIRTSDYLATLPHMILLNFLSMTMGFLFGRMARLNTPTAMTISLETGLQNTGLALAIGLGSGMLNNDDMAVPAATYAMFSFFTTLIFGLWVNRKNVSIKEVLRGLRQRSSHKEPFI